MQPWVREESIENVFVQWISLFIYLFHFLVISFACDLIAEYIISPIGMQFELSFLENSLSKYAIAVAVC